MSENLPTVHKPQLSGGGAVVALVPQTLDEAYRLADALSRSGLTPYNIKTPEAVMACLLAGAELGFPPFQSLQSFAVINGRPSIYGAAVPALLWSRGFDIEETYDGEDDAYPDTMKAVCTITRPNGKIVTRTYSVADAKTAKLWGKRNRDGSDTPWITNPKRMLQMRARGFAAQDGASDIMRGLPLYEEAIDYTPLRDDAPAAGTGMVERLTARATDVDAQGFSVRNITEETRTVDKVLDGDQIPAEGGAKPKRKRRTKAEMEAARAAGEPEVDDDASEEAEAAPEPAEAEDTAPQAEAAQPAGEASEGGAATPVSEPITAAEAGTQDIGGAITAAEYAAQAQPPDSDHMPNAAFRAVASTPHAKPGQTYHLASDPVHENGTRPVYKDGVLAGHAKARDRWSVFAEHAPEVAKPGAVEEKSQPSSDDSPVQDDYQPSVDVAEFKAKMGRADSYQAIRLALGSFRRTRAFQESEEEGQRMFQMEAMERLDELRQSGVAGIPLPSEEPWVWALFAAIGPVGEVVEAYDELILTSAYAGLNPAQKQGLSDTVAQRTGSLD
jgi:hypothetical protein